MDDFMKQDIFFFITTVAVVTLALLFGSLLVYLIRIARTVDDITRKIRAETDIIVQEVSELRRNIRKDGVKLKHFWKFFTAFKGKRN